MKQHSGEIIYVESKLGSMRMTNVLAFLLTRRMSAVSNIMVDMVETSDCSNNHICWRVVQKTVEILVCQGQSEEYEQIIKVSLRALCSPLDFSDQLANILMQNKGYFSRRKTELILGPCARHADKTFAPKISIFVPRVLPVLNRQSGMPSYPEYKLPGKVSRPQLPGKRKKSKTTKEQVMYPRKFLDTFLFEKKCLLECYENILKIIRRQGCDKPWNQITVVALSKELSKIAAEEGHSSTYYAQSIKELKRLGVLEDTGYQSSNGNGGKKTLIHFLEYELAQDGARPTRRSSNGPPTTPAVEQGGELAPDTLVPANLITSGASLLEQIKNSGGLEEQLKSLGAEILGALKAKHIAFSRNGQGEIEVELHY